MLLSAQRRLKVPPRLVQQAAKKVVDGRLATARPLPLERVGAQALVTAPLAPPPKAPVVQVVRPPVRTELVADALHDVPVATVEASELVVARRASLAAPLERPAVAVALQGAALLVRPRLAKHAPLVGVPGEPLAPLRWHHRVAKEALGRVHEQWHPLE